MSRPSDAANAFVEDSSPVGPKLGPIEWVRWAWRQLTSMRVALLLLLALAVAAVPGSLIPQESADPNGVIEWRTNNPQLSGIVDAVQGFTVYTSVWFSAIYLLLFISLIGCVVPRLRHHWRSLRARPPRTPTRFDRLPSRSSTTLPVSAEAALAAAERVLKGKRYRTERYGTSISAERGYFRESGNLLFHSALVGVLLTVFVGGGFTYTGQRVVTTGSTFSNVQSGYDTFTPGRFFTDSDLSPYSLRLDHLAVQYAQGLSDLGSPLDYTATVTTTEAGVASQHTIKVNSPLEVGGTSVYLLGNGYAPNITVTNANGSIAFSGVVPFRPLDATLRSLGVIKVRNTPGTQFGFQGFLYPTVGTYSNGEKYSFYPGLGLKGFGSPLVTLNMYTGPIPVTPESDFALDTGSMTEVAGAQSKSGVKAIELAIGQTQTLPNGLGTIRLNGISRYAAFDVHHDPSQGFVAVFVALAVLGLIVSLLVPRRRMWVKVAEEREGEVALEYAALARGDDPNLERAVAELQRDHAAALAAPTPLRR